MIFDSYSLTNVLNFDQSALFKVSDDFEFSSPQNKNRQSTYWFWHSIPDNEQIVSQIEDMYRAGLRTFLIQPRLAFDIDDYMSSDYLNQYLFAIEYGCSLGFDVGIYDDYNWMSGHAGGLTVSKSKQNQEVQLFWTSGIVVDGKCNLSITNPRPLDAVDPVPAISKWRYLNGLVEWEDWQIVKCLQLPNSTASNPFSSIQGNEDISVLVQNEKVFSVLVTGGKQTLQEGATISLFVTARCRTSRMINYLSRNAVLDYIEVGLEPYASTLGKHMGECIKYIFMDHPGAGYYTWDEHVGNVGNSIPFSTQFIEKMDANFDETIIQRMFLSLIQCEPGVLDKERYLFFSFYTTFVLENYLGNLQKWAANRGVGIAGHEMLSHVGSWAYGDAYGVDTRTNLGDAHFEIDSFRSHTTVDAVNSFPQISSLLGLSVSMANGRSGCLVEQYFTRPNGIHWGAAGWWELSLQELRISSLRHHLFGASQIIMHGYYQTDGFDENFDLFTNPRFDFAPGINYEPWFGRYQNCAIEDARLSQFLYSFRPDIKVGVLYPLATRWIEGPTEDLRSHSSFWNKNLSELGIQFIYINESQLIEAEISKHSLVIDGMTLDVLVLPDYRYFENKETIEKINEFVEANGAVVLSGRVGTQVNLESKNQQALFPSSVLQVPISLEPSRLMTILEPFLHNSFTFESDDNKPIWARVCKKENIYRVALLNDLSASRRLSIQTHSNILVIRIFDCLTGDILSSTKSESDQYLSRIDVLMAAGELVTIAIETIEPTQFRARLAGHWQIESLGARIQRYGNVDLSNQTQFANVSHLKQDLVDFSLLEKGWFLQADSIYYEIDRVDDGWQELLPNWIGCGKYQLHVNHDGRNIGKRVYLMVPSLSGTASVILNGHEIDSIELNSATFDLGIVQELEAELEIHILSSAANRYYSGSDFQEKKQRNGILSIPRLLYFSDFESKGSE